MLSRLYTGGVAVEKYGGGRTAYRAVSTGTFVTKAAAQVLGGGAAELERILMRVWQSSTPAASAMPAMPKTQNVQVTMTGFAPAALAFAKGEGIRNGSAQINAEVKPLVQRLLDKYVIMIQQLAGEVLDTMVYGGDEGEAQIAASALRARYNIQKIKGRTGQLELFKRYQGTYGASDAARLLRRYEPDTSNVFRRSYEPVYGYRSHAQGFAEVRGRTLYGWQGRLTDTNMDVAQGSLARAQLTHTGKTGIGELGKLSGGEGGQRAGLFPGAWGQTSKGFGERLKQGILAKSLIPLTMLFQQVAGLAASGLRETMDKASGALRLPFYVRTGILREAVVQGVKRAGWNILIGVDETPFQRHPYHYNRLPYWMFVETGHQVVVPRPLGKGRPGEYEMVHTGNTVPGRPFMETLFTRVRTEILPMLQLELELLGTTAQQAVFKFIQSAKVSEAFAKATVGSADLPVGVVRPYGVGPL